MDDAFQRILGDEDLTAPVRFFAGTRTAPGITFAGETTSGLYRAAAGDLRLSVLDQDIAFFGKLSGSAALGIGVAPTGGNLHIKRDFAGAAAPVYLENNNTTDGNTQTIDFRGTTSGAGAAAAQQFGAITVEQTTHDHATKASKLSLSWMLTATARFIDISGDGIVARRSGPIELKSAAGNGDVILTPNGTGRVKVTGDGAIATPALAFASQPNMGMYRAASNDWRFAINSVDFFILNFVTVTGATNVPSLGIGAVPLRPGLHISMAHSSATATFIQLENTDTTDGCSTGFSARCTTTGVGAAAMTEIAKFNVRIDTHNHATRESHLDFNFTIAGTSSFIQFINLAGVRGIRSDSGALTVQAISGTLLLNTGSGNNDVMISPNGTGNIVLDLAKRLRIAIGTGQRAGDATLVAGTVTVANTTVTANTKILVSRKVAGGTLGFLAYSVTAATSFTITSSSASDTSTVTYFLIEVS
jgi:hypothetical protein